MLILSAKNLAQPSFSFGLPELKNTENINLSFLGKYQIEVDRDLIIEPYLLFRSDLSSYTFDVSASSVSGHPLGFKDSGDSAYTTGVTVTGTAGSAGANVVIAVPSTGTMPARYYCTTHGNAMGNTIATQTNDIATVAGIASDITTVASNISTIAQKATVDEATALAIALGG